mmetsp:Transcript_29318/g.84228  ORF Transcript_29318/g.84228 Transcript_29318/m.84228 type:complete len:317 (+) Transcript_29318:1032-1982(+)
MITALMTMARNPTHQQMTAKMPTTSIPSHSCSKQMTLLSSIRVFLPFGLRPQTNMTRATFTVPAKKVNMSDRKALMVRSRSTRSLSQQKARARARDRSHVAKKASMTMPGMTDLRIRFLWKVAMPAHPGLNSTVISLATLKKSSVLPADDGITKFTFRIKVIIWKWFSTTKRVAEMPFCHVPHFSKVSPKRNLDSITVMAGSRRSGSAGNMSPVRQTLPHSAQLPDAQTQPLSQAAQARPLRCSPQAAPGSPPGQRCALAQRKTLRGSSADDQWNSFRRGRDRPADPGLTLPKAHVMPSGQGVHSMASGLSVPSVL